MGEWIGQIVDGGVGISVTAVRWAWWLIDLIPFGPAAVLTVVSAGFAGLVFYVAIARLQDLWQQEKLTKFWKVIALLSAAIFYPIDAFLAVIAGIVYYQSLPKWHEKEFLLTALTQRLINDELVSSYRYRRAVAFGQQLNVIDADHIKFPTATEKVATLGEN